VRRLNHQQPQKKHVHVIPDIPRSSDVCGLTWCISQLCSDKL